MILIEGQIEGIMTRKDRTLKITLGSQEMSPEKVGMVMSVNQKHTFIAIKEQPFQDEERAALEEAKSEYSHPKTQAQRLRGVMYINWKQNNEGYNDFTSYYQYKMERIIEHYKSQLE